MIQQEVLIPDKWHQYHRIIKEFFLYNPPQDQKTLTLNLDLWRTKHHDLVIDAIANPTKFTQIIQQAIQPQLFTDKRVSGQKIKISMVGNLGNNFVTPRGLNSSMADQLVGIQGMVTKLGQKSHKITKLIQYCQDTNQKKEQYIHDSYCIDKDFDPKQFRGVAARDKDGNPLSIEYGLTHFKDVQYLVVQQLPQRAPIGLLPISVDVYLTDQLVDKCKPGDRVQIIGQYKLTASNRTRQKAIFNPILIASSIQQMTIKSIPNIRNLSYPEDKLLQLFSNSISPSVFGHQTLKKAILLQLLGGVQKQLSGTRLRGNINILMIGDPGTAKSQILRWVTQVADISIGTTGSGATGVGLTASVNMDKDSGERILQAGAMVLADRGIVCIDQFDKMQQIDRVAIHQVMQQQTVTIAKAGICCSLNARCSVLAAANPIYGQYQSDLPPTKNVGFQDSLLSRFDLIFIIEDKREEELDRLIADRVCRNHQFCPVNANLMRNNDGFIVQPMGQSRREQGIFQKNPVFMVSGRQKRQILTQSYLKDYIRQAKKKQPFLTEQALQYLNDKWVEFRQMDLGAQHLPYKALPITIRTLETLNRLSSAHAKLRLSNQVTKTDAIVACSIFEWSLRQEFSHQYQTQIRQQKQRIKEKVQSKLTSTTHVSSERKSIKGKKEEEITKKLGVISIQSPQKKQPEEAVSQVISQRITRSQSKVYKPTAEQEKHVFQAFSSFKKQNVMLKDLVKKVKGMSGQQVEGTVRSLHNKNKLFFNQKEQKIHEY